MAGAASTAAAQHASDNAVVSADDAFGLTLGLETIGLYNSGNVRGFNPQAAGNVRIDGLYFDQAGTLSNHVLEDSRIRVGISAMDYAFPAPTGIVDYDLRHVSDDKNTVTVVVGAGPFESRNASIDASLAILPGKLELPLGVSTQVSAQEPGYTFDAASFGVAPKWSPNDQVVVRGFYDWNRNTDGNVIPYVFTQGPFLPPPTNGAVFGQNWATDTWHWQNFGGTVAAQLSPGWSLAAGLFRSILDNSTDYSDLYVNAQPSGWAEHLLVGSPDQRSASTSGETRLTHHFVKGAWFQDITVLVRGRDSEALYGGSDVVDVGMALVDQGVQIPRPQFQYSARTSDHTLLWSSGVAYHAGWHEHGEFTLGLQKENYDKEVISPDAPRTRLTDQPWRAYGTIAVSATDRATVYGSFIQGLEDSGVAPANAENRGAILPAALTWQIDAGVRYQLTPNIKVIAGAFSVTKPYANFDASNNYQILGSQTAQGMEFSIAGAVSENLHLNAGAVIDQDTVTGQNLIAEGIGSRAVGQPRDILRVSADYRVSSWPAASVDVEGQEWGSVPASVDDKTTVPSYLMLNIGGRYRFTVRHAQATLRLVAQGLTNHTVWYVGQSPGFYAYSGRSFVAYLTVDM